MATFINDNISVMSGRKAAKISKRDLLAKIFQAAAKYDVAAEYGVNPKDEPFQYLALCAVSLLYRDPIVGKDTNILVDSENYTYEPDDVFGDGVGNHLNGLRTIGDFTFYGIQLGGDWEVPIFLIIYWDGKHLRSYAPPRGNPINMDCKCALGSENDTNTNFSALETKYQSLGIYSPNLSWAEMYCSKYGTTPDTVEFNWDGIWRNIQTRIQVI